MLVPVSVRRPTGWHIGDSPSPASADIAASTEAGPSGQLERLQREGSDCAYRAYQRSCADREHVSAERFARECPLSRSKVNLHGRSRPGRRSFIKAVVDADSGHSLGCAVLGSEGGENMTVIQAAVLGKLTYTAIADPIFRHPLPAECPNALFAMFDG